MRPHRSAAIIALPLGRGSHPGSRPEISPSSGRAGPWLGGKPPGIKRLDSRIFWFVEQLDELEHVRVGLYERARESSTIADFLTRLAGGSRIMLRNVLAGHVPDSDLELAAQTLLATIDGARLQQLDRGARRRIIEFAVRRVAA